MVATVTSAVYKVHSSMRVSIDAKTPSFNGLKACGNIASRRCVLSASTSAGRIRAGRSTAVIECRKVAVLGAGGGIGQPLSLLLKMNTSVTKLALYDIANVKGVAADLSHCNTPGQVTIN